MSSESVIRANNVGKVFRSYAKPHHRLTELLLPGASRNLGRDFHALEAIDFEVYKGETVGIVGRNGSGKSTLLQILCGIMEPSSGSVTVRGRIAALLELGSGFNPEFTGLENVRLYAGVLGFSSAEIERKLPDIIEFADIGHFIHEPVKHYSSGMYVRLAFSASIHVDPDILVVDEALSVGDEAFQRKCFSRIEEIKRRGATILFVSHAASTILQLCDRALVLYNGRRTYLGKPNSAIAIYQRILYAPPDRIDDLVARAHALDLSGADWGHDKDELNPAEGGGGRWLRMRFQPH
jgi:lipopolysaccharide transport system ATP-binding protein